MRNIIIFIVSLIIVNSIYAQKYLYSNEDSLEFSDDYGTTTFGAKNITHWPINSITWYMNQAGAGDGLTPGESETELKKGFQEWEDIDDCDIDFEYGGRVSETYGVDSQNVVYWSVADDDYIDDLSSNLASYAVTYLTTNINKEIVEVDIVFTGLDKVGLTYIDWNNDGTGEDVWEFTTHEVGHMIGLGHSDNSSASMYGPRGLFRRDVNSEDEFGASFITSGKIIANTSLPSTWNSIHFDWPITVKSGVTLSYSPTTSNPVVNFRNNSSISVYGTLDINGTSTHEPTIDFISKTSNNGIKVYNGGTAYIENAEIKNAVYGVYATDAEVEIFNSDIESCTYGTYFTNGTEAYVKGCKITGSSSYGVYCTYSSDVKLTGNYIGQIYSPVNRTGVHAAFNCNLRMYGNVIKYSIYNGIQTYYSNITRLGYPYNWVGKNTVVDNGSNELYAGYGNPDVDLCQSSVHDDSGYEIYNYSGNQTISAQSCWYGGSLYKYGAVSNFSDLTSQPTWEGNVQFDDTSVPKKSMSEDIPDKYRGYDGVISLKEKIDNLVGSEEDVSKNLKDLYSVLRNDYKKDIFGEKETFYDFLDTKVKDKKIKKTEKQASKYQINWKVLEKDFKEAIKLSEEFLKNDPMDDYFEVSMTLANLYLITGKKNQAEKIFVELSNEADDEEELFIDHLKTQLTEDYVAAPQGEFVEKGIESNESETFEIITDYELNGNYPNPFNPTTTIKYSIPEVSNVSLIIYDMMGKEIRAFEKNGLSAGQHSTVWDGTNNNGERVSSGVYIYKLRAVSLSGNGKIFEKASKLMMLK